jgi:hypothetical protein
MLLQLPRVLIAGWYSDILSRKPTLWAAAPLPIFAQPSSCSNGKSYRHKKNLTARELCGPAVGNDLRLSRFLRLPSCPALLLRFGDSPSSSRRHAPFLGRCNLCATTVPVLCHSCSSSSRDPCSCGPRQLPLDRAVRAIRTNFVSSNLCPSCSLRRCDLRASSR